MSATPPLGTLVIQNIDALGPNAVVGIDTQFFTVQHFLKGIKSIPAGPHLLHYSASVDDGASMRYAWWFQCADGDVLSVRWAEEEAFFEAYDASLSDLGDIYPFMVSYPEKPDKWRVLSEFLDAEALEEYLPRREQAVTTATPSAEENMVLLEVLKRQKSDIELSDQSQDELKYTIIQSQKRRPDTVGEQLTRDSLDRSWYLAEVFGHDMELLLAEIQLSFIHFIVLCNLCSYTQWMNLVGLVSNNTLPPDYVLGTSSLQVVEVARLETMLSQLNDIFHGEQQWHELLEIAHKKLHLKPVLGSIVDDEHFEVYDLSGYDEEDEDAPAIVF